MSRIARMNLPYIPRLHTVKRHSRMYHMLLNSEDWAMEQKRSGIRAFLIHDRNGLSMRWRDNREVSSIGQDFWMDVVEECEIPINTILDGVLRLSQGPRYDAFDVIWLSGAELAELSYKRRKKALARLELGGRLAHLQHAITSTEKGDMWTDCERHDDGFVFKLTGSQHPSAQAYGIERTGLWLKCEIDMQEESYA